MSSTGTAQDAGQPVPRLCKYRSMDEGKTREYTLAILKNLELRYSPASKFNDPFDCHLDVALRSTKEWTMMVDEWIRRTKAGLTGFFSKLRRAPGTPDPPEPELQPEPRDGLTLTIKIKDSDGRWRRQSPRDVFNRLHNQHMARLYSILDESFGVLCLSERPDDILLWSHYGGSHGGLVLEFNVAGHPKAFPRLHKVSYRQKYPAIPPEFPQLLEAFRDKGKGIIKETLLNVADVLAGELGSAKERPSKEVLALGLAQWFYVKSSRWKYEREWRCVKSQPGPQAFPPKALTRIIAGCVNTEATVQLVRDAIKGTAIETVPLYKAVRNPRKFGLTIVPVNGT